MPLKPVLALAVSALFVLVVGPAAHAAGQDPTERATAAFQAEDWAGTEAAAHEMIEADAGNPQAHFFLAVALMHREHADQALAELDRAAELGYPAAAVEYRRACALAVLGRLDDGFAALDRAIAAGLGQMALLEGEPLLAPLRADARFAGVREAVDKAQHPCRHDPRYRQFDFWLGTWDVRPNGAPDTTPPSENVVTLEYDGCVVMEHWTGRGGVTGSSFNVYDASRGEWFQTWVDSTGGLNEYHGKPDADGNMIFEGTAPGAPGQPARVPTQLSFFRMGPDKVRQLGKSSTDGGKTWKVDYDLIYVRRPGTPRP